MAEETKPLNDCSRPEETAQANSADAGKQVTAGKGTKSKTCLDCGFLTIEGRELKEWDRALLRCLTRTASGGYSMAELPSGVEWTRCFKNLWKDYDPHWSGFSCAGLIVEKERDRINCLDFAPYEVGFTPAELIKQIEERVTSERMEQVLAQIARKHGRRRRRENETPSRDEKVIIDAINEGLKGEGFCFRLDERHTKPRPEWESKTSRFPWPGNYMNAYKKGHPLTRKHWQNRIQDYKSKTSGNAGLIRLLLCRC